MPSSLPVLAPSGAPPEAPLPRKGVGGRRKAPWNPRLRQRPLMPWEAQWIAWYLKQRSPAKTAQVVAAEEFAQRTVTYESLRLLRHTPQFEEFADKLLEQQRKAAERAFDMQAGEAVEAHFEGMREAARRVDYKALPAFTVPILDRIKPKRADPVVSTPNVVINITQEQLRVAQAPPPTVEYEALDAGRVEVVE